MVIKIVYYYHHHHIFFYFVEFIRQTLYGILMLNASQINKSLTNSKRLNSHLITAIHFRDGQNAIYSRILRIPSDITINATMIFFLQSKKKIYVPRFIEWGIWVYGDFEIILTWWKDFAINVFGSEEEVPMQHKSYIYVSEYKLNVVDLQLQSLTKRSRA